METIDLLKRLDKRDITFKRVIAAMWRRISSLPQILLFYCPFGFYKKNRDKLKALKNIHKGERCFIICNGPSLKEIDFSLLKNEFTLGMNRIYLMKEQNGFEPTYLGCVDKNSQILHLSKEVISRPIVCSFKAI